MTKKENTDSFSIRLGYDLHNLLSALPHVRYPFSQEDIPQNGVYVLFEEGETYGQYERIVGIGTHIIQGELPASVADHYIKQNKDHSILRKNIGRAILYKNKDPYRQIWEYDLARTKNIEILHAADSEYQQHIEDLVSIYIREKITIAFIPIPESDSRLRLADAITAALISDPDFRPGAGWFGRFHPQKEIAESGLWQVKGFDGEPLSEAEFAQLKNITDRCNQ